MKTKADAERAAMMAVAKHPFEKGLLEHVSKEMEGWAYFIGNNDAANKVMAAIIIKATDEFRQGAQPVNESKEKKIDFFNPDTYISKQ